MTDEGYSAQAHNQAAGRYDGLSTCLNIVNAHAGQAFIDGRDDLARKLRDVAAEIDAHTSGAKGELDAWITKAMKR